MAKVEKEDILRAILVADDFEDVLSPFLRSTCSVFLPLASRKILDYSLEYLSQSGINETILFCSSKADLIKDYVRQSQWTSEKSSMKIIVVVSEQCNSLGDAMRDVDGKALIKSDFVLLSTSTITNIHLKDALNFHKSQAKKDRGAAMTLILQDRGCTSKGEETTAAMDADTKRLLIYQKAPIGSKLQVSMEYITEHPNIRISSTLKDTGLAICSPSVPLLFSDNFDFQTKEDFIRGLLMNEEVLASSIYCLVTSSYGLTVLDLPSYQRVSNDVIHRWTYPLVPDGLIGQGEPLIHQRGCVYKHPDANLSRGCKLEMDVVIGKGCILGSNVQMLRCVIGEKCKIGDGVTIQDSYLMDGVTVEAGSLIILSVVGDGATVGANATLKNCQLHHSVTINKQSDLEDKCISSQPVDGRSEKLSESAYVLTTGDSDSESDAGVADKAVHRLHDPNAVVDDDEASSSDSGSEDSRSASPQADDCSLFYSEVMDSLQRGYEEKLPCGNLILEVNSSRYAYNVTLSEVTQLTSKAVFTLPSRLHCPAKPLLQYFKPLFENYVKTDDAQMECLTAFEESFESLGNEMNGCIHYLYDSDVLSEESIVNWYDELEGDTPIKVKLEKFMTWLKEAAEESDEEDDD